MTRFLFISDLHLHSSRPAATDCFLRFLEREAGPDTRLYILGDLFESWVGDDDADADARRVIAGLRRFADAGARCALIHGNRDFLLGRRFAGEACVQLLPDEVVEDLHGQRVLLMHGDQLCTDDLAYQRFRRRVRRRWLQQLFLALPRPLRHRVGSYARAESETRTATAPPVIMDVNQQTVLARMALHDVTTLVHGHTHRPAVHELAFGTTPGRRIVLGDWYRAGSVLTWRERGPELRSLPFAAD